MKAPELATMETAAASAELALRFHGRAGEYFRIWVVNLFLTLATLGIFSAWAKVRKKRYFYAHTTLDGTPFQYLGQPIPILKGRVVAAALFIFYYFTSHFFTALLPYVLVAGALLAPWVVAGSAAFNARYSAFRNMTFRFDGGYRGAFQAVTFSGLLVATAVGLGYATHSNNPMLAGAMFGIFGLIFPWWQRRTKAFIVGNMSFGDHRGDFSAKGGQFFRIYFVAGLILSGIGVATALLGGVLAAAFKNPMLSMVAFLLPIYLGYVLAFAYAQAKVGNLVWNSTRLGPLRFESTLSGRGLAKLYVVNALAIIASAGLLIPWAVMRTLAYRVSCLKVLPEGNLREFEGTMGGTVRATGAEVGEFFDLDLSL